MENLHDYSSYITYAYFVAGFALVSLMAITMTKYFLINSKVRNDK